MTRGVADTKVYVGKDIHEAQVQLYNGLSPTVQRQRKLKVGGLLDY